LEICADSTGLPVRLLMRWYPTGAMSRRSIQSRSMVLLCDAGLSTTGMVTRPNEIAPRQMMRDILLSSTCHITRVWAAAARRLAADH
jgi:hypothetical protein